MSWSVLSAKLMGKDGKPGRASSGDQARRIAGAELRPVEQGDEVSSSCSFFLFQSYLELLQHCTVNF